MSSERSQNGAGKSVPEKPTGLPREAWGGVLKRTVAEFREDNITDWAAALTYYGILSIFPALIALVSILGLIGHAAIDPLQKNLGTFAPGPARQILENALHGLTGSRGGAGILFVVGLGAAIWSAAGYIGAFIRASNAIWDVEEGRPIWKTLPLRLGITIVMLMLLTVTAIAVTVTGPIAHKAGNLLGVGSAAVTAWDIAKWPVLVIIVALMFSILYYAAPNVRQLGFRWVTPGGILAVVVWLVVSALFGLYVGNFGSYNKTYGSLGAVVIFLVWLWLTNIAILFGAELNAETTRGRQIEAGHPADREPFLPPRTRANYTGPGASARYRSSSAPSPSTRTSSESSSRHPLTRFSASRYACSTSSAGGMHAILVDAIGPIRSASPSMAYSAVKRLQPVNPATRPSANVALGATNSQPATSMPPEMIHGTPTNESASPTAASP
jgi:membrane protein